MSNNNRVYNVLIVGVGGQGIILASDVLGKVAAAYGYDV
jgi:Pyruvate/2-oxoacid:ferredoxin oxidoreductase gamma subunit